MRQEIRNWRNSWKGNWGALIINGISLFLVCGILMGGVVSCVLDMVAKPTPPPHWDIGGTEIRGL